MERSFFFARIALLGASPFRIVTNGGYAVVRDILPSAKAFGRIFNQHTNFGWGTALAAFVMLAGAMNVASIAVAQAETKEACIAACEAEKKKCPERMYTPEMCSMDHKECTQACEKK
jgi:hypothetical protein